MSEPPHNYRGSQPYLPPPPETGEDSPEALDVPRMEPPPASLEAMVRSGPGSRVEPERDSTWLWVSLLLVVGVLVSIYIIRSSH